MRRLFLVAIATLFATAAANAGPELITNGGFETGTVAGWTQGGNTGFTGVTTAPYNHSGTFGLFAGPVGSLGTLSQTFNSPANFVEISFWLENFGGPTNNFDVSLNGGPALTSLTNSSAFGYTQYSFISPSNVGANTLTFRFRQDPSFFGLDDVSVKALPEPMSMALFGGMVAVGGLVARRRMTKASA